MHGARYGIPGEGEVRTIKKQRSGRACAAVNAEWQGIGTRSTLFRATAPAKGRARRTWTGERVYARLVT